MSPENGPRPLRQGLERLLDGLGAPDIDAVATLVERSESSSEKTSSRSTTGLIPVSSATR